MMTPADSWPRMWLSVTTMGPMRPACQKWMSDLDVDGISRPVLWTEGVVDEPADTCALDTYGDLAGFEAVTFLDAVETGSRVRYP